MADLVAFACMHAQFMQFMASGIQREALSSVDTYACLLYTILYIEPQQYAFAYIEPISSSDIVDRMFSANCELSCE
jgi:hypothetical protein